MQQLADHPVGSLGHWQQVAQRLESVRDVAGQFAAMVAHHFGPRLHDIRLYGSLGGALLISRGMQPRTHRGLQQLLGLHFVLTGELPAEAAELIRDLQQRRETVEYVVQTQATEAEAREAILAARRVAGLCRPLLPFLPQEL